MITDLEASLLCFRSYFEPGYFDKIFDNGSVYIGYKLIGGIPVFAGRGTDDDEDIRHDFESLIPVNHPVLGRVPDGFVEGLDDTFAAIQQALPSLKDAPLVAFTGHSLGADHAFYLGRLFKGVVRKRVAVLFGLSHCGENNDPDYEVRAFKNGDDPVTDVPFEMGAIEQIPVSVAAISPDPWLLLKDHRIHYYALAMALRGDNAQLPS